MENIIQKLAVKCDADVEKAQTGIVHIDEIDKISRKSDKPVHHPRRLARAAQQALLVALSRARLFCSAPGRA